MQTGLWFVDSYRQKKIEMLKFDNHIILDSIETWPSEIVEVIQADLRQLECYIRVEDDYEEKIKSDPILKITRYENVFKSYWIKASKLIDEILCNKKIISFHCTRLVDYEISDILKNGLKPLDGDFSIKRIKELFDNGLISEKSSQELKKNNNCYDENREGMLFFFHFIKTLKDESGLEYLFRYWGGEAIYRNHKENEELKTIGKPCIIEIGRASCRERV